MDYGLFNLLSFGMNGRGHVRLLLGLAARRLPAHIVRIFDFVGLSCTDGSGCLPVVNGIDRMFSFLNLKADGRTIVYEGTVSIDEPPQLNQVA